MSTRKISDIQFEDKTVISGDNIDTFLEDATTRFNLLPPTDDKSSWLQQQMVFGYTERRCDWKVDEEGSRSLREPPFMNAVQNDINNPDYAIRMKGTNHQGSGVNVQTGNVVGNPFCNNGFIWQVSFWADRPMVLTDFDMFLQTDDDYIEETNTPYSDYWQWNAAGPVSTIGAEDYVQDVVCQLTVDAPFNASDVDGTNVELHKSNFSCDAQFSAFNKAWSSDMVPSLDARKAWGVCITARDINCPIPAKSRVRMNLFIPNWTVDQTAPNDNRWSMEDGSGFRCAWRLQQYNGTLTYLERKI